MFIQKNPIIISLLIILLLFSVTACSGSNSTENQVKPPVEQSNIRGMVTKVEGNKIFVEEDPNEQTVTAKADIELSGETKFYIKKKSGYVEGKQTDIKQRSRVDIWFTGLIKDSYPIEAKASHVMIDTTSENK